MIQSLSGLRISRRRVALASLLMVMATLAVVELWVAKQRVASSGWTPFARPGSTDFGSYYMYAQIGLHHGWNHLYDTAVEHQAWLADGGAGTRPFYPMVYPPPLAWLVIPMTVLPLAPAVWLWGLSMLALLVGTWRLTVSGDRIERWTLLAAGFCLFPVIFGLYLGQIVIVIIFAVVLSWWLVRADREVFAGLALLPIVIKPQVVFLVPLALLVMGRRRTFVTFAAGSVIIAALAVLSVGPQGVHDYVDLVTRAAGGAREFLIFPGANIPGLVGRGAAGVAGALLVSGLALRAAWVHRREGPDVPVTAALVGSLLATPYIHEQDFTLLLVAGWIYLRSPRPPRDRMLLLTGYLILLFRSFFDVTGLVPVLSIGLVTIEVIWLALMAGAAVRLEGRAGRRADRERLVHDAG